MPIPFRDLQSPMLLGIVLEPALPADELRARTSSLCLPEGVVLRIGPDDGGGAACVEVDGILEPPDERALEETLRAALPLGPRIVAVERLYLFDWAQFDAGTWDALARRYSSTLGWRRGSELARWFDTDEDAVPHLWASVEPPGLQVAGALDEALWKRWHDAFVAAMEGLPVHSD